MMTGSWTPAGDDASGRRYTTQTYDWMGRPLVTTAPDGTTREASYGGCGCAGGAVVTLRGEEVMISGVARRRQQTITHDALGRAIRADEMLWDGVTVYRTLRTSYNARDQVTEVRQEGASASARVTTIGYDGHGRVASEQRPEQTAATSYLYYPDDTVQQVTDARGATANFLYNARHLVTQVSYTTPDPAMIPHTPTVTYRYDAAGNRTWMADGLGTVSYEYDQLSQLRVETRQLTGVARSHALTYDYNLAGELKSITDPFTSTVSYNRDSVGRVIGVTGAGTGSAPVYVSAIQYRAWGAARRVTYGNNIYADVEYNARLQPSQFELGGRNTQSGGSSVVMRAEYHYSADGRLRFSDDQIDNRFDRAYSFDHVGRLQEAYTGGEALNFHNNQTGGTADGAYRQTYSHDEWDNLTSRVGRFWSQYDSFGAAFNSQNRNAAWSYDAQGTVTQDETRVYVWDAAGRNVYSQAISDANRNLTQSYDGDGRRVKRVGLNEASQMETSFYVTSSVMGGRMIAEADAHGAQLTGYVMVGGEVVARRVNGVVQWRHQDVVTGNRVVSDATAVVWPESPVDPQGVAVGLEDPFIFASVPPEAEAPSLMNYGDFYAGNCTLDGMRIECARVSLLMETGAAVQCPNNDCGPRTLTVIARNRDGQVIGSTSTLRMQGQVGWDGSLDGTYQVLNRSSVRFDGSYAGISSFLNAAARAGNSIGEFASSLGGVAFQRTSAGFSFKPQENDRFGVEYLRDNRPRSSYGESERRRIEDELIRVVGSDRCAQAFRDAGLRTVPEIIARGLVISPATNLRQPGQNVLGVTGNTLSRARRRVESSGTMAFTIWDRVGDSRPAIFFNSFAFQQSEANFRKTVIHELIHAAGVAGVTGWGILHDLSDYEHFDRIVEACR